MLAATAPATLARLRFPLGELTKPEVRALAAEAGLPVASKADSQDLCFLAGTDRASFLARHGDQRGRPGEIVRRDGRVLGRHRGHQHYTVGQRRGLGVAATEPLYVLATDAASNRVDGRPARRSAGRARRGARGHAVPRRCGRRPGQAPLPLARAPRANRGRARCGRSPPPRARARRARRRRRPGADGVPDGRRGDRRPRHHRPVLDSGSHAQGHELGRDPRDVPLLLRGARPQAPAERLARARDARPLGAADHGGHAAAQALLPRAGGAAAPPAHHLPEGLPDDRHRERRQHHTASHLLRDARELLDRRLLQAGRRRVRVGVLAGGARAEPGGHLDHGVRGRRGARARPRRGGDGRVGVRRGSARAHRPVPAQRELLAGRSDGPVRPLLRALLRPRRGVRRPGRPARRRERAFRGVLEPRVHGVQPGPGEHARPTARQEHRHRAGAQPHGDDPPGRPVHLRDRPVQAADRAGGGAVGSSLRKDV